MNSIPATPIQSKSAPGEELQIERVQKIPPQQNIAIRRYVSDSGHVTDRATAAVLLRHRNIAAKSVNVADMPANDTLGKSLAECQAKARDQIWVHDDVGSPRVYQGLRRDPLDRLDLTGPAPQIMPDGNINHGQPAFAMAYDHNASFIRYFEAPMRAPLYSLPGAGELLRSAKPPSSIDSKEALVELYTSSRAQAWRLTVPSNGRRGGGGMSAALHLIARSRMRPQTL